MTTQKDLKRVVRARMKKTGESYTAARAQVIRKPKLEFVKPDYARIAGMSDAVVKEKTGCDWEKWVYALDRRGADKLTHREITDIIHTKYKVGPWWTQMVAVGYERIKGLRGKNQRRDGSFEATKSKTYNVDVETLYDAWAKPARRKKWLPAAVKVRTATAPKSMRLDWPEGGIVAVGFYPKGQGKSSVAVQHEKLPDRDTATRIKAEWAEHLAALAVVLKP